MCPTRIVAFTRNRIHIIQNSHKSITLMAHDMVSVVVVMMSSGILNASNMYLIISSTLLARLIGYNHEFNTLTFCNTLLTTQLRV